ncbi:ribulose-phosphate 3-epimerase [Mesoterricola silvestris]|uniref:Ribulose-phosphate 3-epimerase n=1 Tax=Mesoterricola silvestris TaxID=2927979 RepID=A0AA48K8N8_9BACT|nr:ribulose-phosphate 3-epimerase [Mesoterricola silvestris]BDU73114.1 ribulose-phosphate 3-epimerase [Mesoterricola silvestris]
MTRPQPLLAPSILSADFARLAESLQVLGDRCVVHVDVMDGRFVPNLTLGMPVVAALRKETRLPLDCHLMIVEPSKYALEFVKAGADWVSIHQEADPHAHRTLTAIREAGAKAGIVLNPGTPVETLTDLVGVFDFVLLMSVNPGFGGQSFIPRVLDKVRRLDALRREREADFFIQVDGGVGPGNAGALVAAGADVLVAGNAVFKAPDPRAAIAGLLKAMDA